MAIATEKVTFTLDEATVRRLGDAAKRLAKPKSQVVREAVEQYHNNIGKLSEAEKQSMLAALDKYAALPQTRSLKEMEAELKEIRRARRHGGRRHRY
jgi:predicted DNA-binding protein